MENNQTTKSIIETIAILRRQRKRPDRISIAKLVASKHGLSESMVIGTVANLLSEAVIYNKPNKQGDESLYVSKMNAEALSIIETDEEEDEEEGIDKTRPQQTQKNGKKQNQVFTNDLPSMEDQVMTATDTTCSIGRAIPQTSTNEITVPDTHIMQEPDNLSTMAYGDPFAIPTNTPQPLGKTPSHIPIPEARISDIEISSRPNNYLSLAHTITKLADSISKLNQLLEKEREKSERLLCENFTLKTKNLELQSSIESNTNPKGNEHTVAKKAIEIGTSLISDAEKFHRKNDNILQAAAEPCNNEHCANKRNQAATEVKTNKKSRSTEQDKNQTLKTASGKNNNNSSGKTNRCNNQSTNKTRKEQHSSEPNGNNKKKIKVLIVGDSQLRRVDESKLSNSHREVEKRFQPGMRIGQAVDRAGKSNSNDVIIVHAATNNVASSTPEKLCEETVRTLKQIQANNPKAKVAFSSIFKRKDNMALNNTVKKVNELLEAELALNGLDMIDNSNIMFSNLWDDGLHINDGGIRKFSGNISSFIKYC